MLGPARTARRKVGRTVRAEPLRQPVRGFVSGLKGPPRRVEGKLGDKRRPHSVAARVGVVNKYYALVPALSVARREGEALGRRVSFNLLLRWRRQGWWRRRSRAGGTFAWARPPKLLCKLQSRLEAGVAQSKLHVPFLAAAPVSGSPTPIP